MVKWPFQRSSDLQRLGIKRSRLESPENTHGLMQTHKIETRTKGASLLLGIVRLSLTNQSQLPASNWNLPSPGTSIFAENWCLENDPETFFLGCRPFFYGAKIFVLGYLVVSTSTHPKINDPNPRFFFGRKSTTVAFFSFKAVFNGWPKGR